MNMKLIVEVTTLDEKTNSFECVDFPSYGDRFLTLYLPGFVRETISMESIFKTKQYFKA